MLTRLRDEDGAAQDLLESKLTGIWDAVFACLFVLSPQRKVTSYRMLAFRVAVEYLQVFLLVFNPSLLWSINTENWLWRGLEWVLMKELVWDKARGHDSYVSGVYGVVGSVLALAALSMLTALLVSKLDTSSWLAGKIQDILHLVSLVLFCVYWVAVLDYLAFMFNCHLTYTTALLVALSYHPEPVPEHYKLQMTMAVLYGIFPVVLAGMGLSWFAHKWSLKPLQMFIQARREVKAGTLNLNTAAAFKAIYRPRSPHQIEFLHRVVRQFDPVTGTVVPEAVALANLIIQVGMAAYPKDPTILMLYANFVIYVRQHARGARTQLQQMAECNPGIVERYRLFSASELLRASRADADAGLDLMAFVEFQRHYRACVKAHKAALMAQRAFWRSVLDDKLKLSNLLSQLGYLHKAEQKAMTIYKRVLERYPSNGKLLKIWGRFQEWVLHDPARAARTYTEAAKRGLLGDSMFNLTEQDDDEAKAKRQAQKFDERTDGVIVIDAKGSMLLANQAACKLFGYSVGELEGKNVAIMMPQPFSGRHDKYLSNFSNSGVPKILDTSRHVVGLRKDHVMIPLHLYVRKLSGSGSEAIFMGTLRAALEEDPSIARVWTTPSGLILCSDIRFCEWFGISSDSLVGKTFSSMAVEPEPLEQFLLECRYVSIKDAEDGRLRTTATLKHKYLQTMDVDITVTFGGTDTERITLYKENLSSLIPMPSGQLHKAWVKDVVPGTHARLGSCRANGAVMHMLAGDGARVPVRLDISSVHATHGEKNEVHHIAKVTKATSADFVDSRRARLVVDQRGVVVAVPGTLNRHLFGFDGKDLVGRPLAAFINLFEDFRVEQATQQQLQQRLKEQFGSNAPSSDGSAPAIQVTLDMHLDVSDKRAGAAPSGMHGAAFGSVTGAADVSGMDDSMLLSILARAAQEGGSASYRVGVRPCPLKEKQIGNNLSRSLFNTTAGGVSAAGSASWFAHVSSGGEKGAAVLATLKGAAVKVRPAILMVDVADEDADFGAAVDQGTGAAHFVVDLWRADVVRGCLELDPRMRIIKADAAVGQLLGCSSKLILGMKIMRLLTIPIHVMSSDDMLRDTTSGKLSAMKKKVSQATVGPIIKATGKHADGTPVRLLLQAVPKDAQNNGRLLIRLLYDKPLTNGNLQAMLQLAGATTNSVSGTGATIMNRLAGKSVSIAGQQIPLKISPGMLAGAFSSAETSASGQVPGRLRTSGDGMPAAAGTDSAVTQADDRAVDARRASRGLAQLEQGDSEEDKANRGHRSSSKAANKKQAALFAVHQDAEQEAEEPASEDGSQHRWPSLQPGKHAPRSSQKRHSAADEDDRGGGGWAEEAERRLPQAADQHRRSKGKHQQDSEEEQETDQEDDWRPAARGQQLPKSSRQAAPGGFGDEDGYGSVANGFGAKGRASTEEVVPGHLAPRDQPAPGSDGGFEDASTYVDGLEAGVSDKLEGTSAMAEGENIACDWRRGKRLKAITRQLTSPVARQALAHFWQGSWVVVGLLALAHVICFTIFLGIVQLRHRDMFGVQQLTYAVDTSQWMMRRANLMSKCTQPDFSDLPLCSKKEVQFYLSKFIENTAKLHHYHSGLFLGFAKNKVDQFTDPRLMNYWVLPMHQETAFFDTTPPQTVVKNTSLWSLGNRFVYAAREVSYNAAAGVWGTELEATRDWQYMKTNGRDGIFQGYIVSLDMYVRFCWRLLGGLRTQVAILMVVELMLIGLTAMAAQMYLTRQVSVQRMACFSVFLALPSATVRAMATQPIQVDDADEDEEADDEFFEGAGQGAEAQNSTTGADAAGEALTARKSVRVMVAGADDAPQPKGRTPRSGSGKSKGKDTKGGTGRQLSGIRGWFHATKKAVKHQVKSLMNQPIKVNGKQLQPAHGAFARFLLPWLLWCLFCGAMYGVSFDNVSHLQEPLTSLQASAKVQYLIGRTHLLANMLGFQVNATDTPQRRELHQELQGTLDELKETYFTLLYGGLLKTQVPGEADLPANAAVFRSSRTSELYFKTNKCLRTQRPCEPPGSKWYDVTHNGLDAMLQRFVNDMEIFLSLPISRQSVRHPCFEFTWGIARFDLYEGLTTAGNVFVEATLDALQQLEQVHDFLLAGTIVVLLVQICAMLIPFRRQLLRESFQLAGLLSMLPQEVDVEVQVKALVLDVAKKNERQRKKGWSLANKVTAAAAAAARAARAASEAARLKMTEAAAPPRWQPDEQESDGASDQEW
eukprot:gene13181-13312_t